MNDFDEVFVSDWKVDLFHNTMDMYLAFEGVFGRKILRDAMKILTHSYLDTLEKRHFRQKPLTEIVIDDMPAELHDAMHSDAGDTQLDLLRTFTTGSGDGRRLKREEGLEDIEEDDEYAMIRSGLEAYHDRMPGSAKKTAFEILDIAKRTGAGLGSYGTPRYFALIRFGGQFKILDIKSEVFRPAGYYFAPEPLVGEYERFVHETEGGDAAFRVLGRSALIGGDETFAGWLSVAGIPFFVRERKPVKKEINFSKIKTVEQLNLLAEEIGKLIAGNHVHAHHMLVDSGRLLGVSGNSFKEGVLTAVKHKHTEAAKYIADIGETLADYMHSFVGVWPIPAQ
jgi:hypothetical protein